MAGGELPLFTELTRETVRKVLVGSGLKPQKSDKTGPRSSISLLETTKIEASDATLTSFRTVSELTFSETQGARGHKLGKQAGTKNPARRHSQRAGKGKSLVRSYISSMHVHEPYCQVLTRSRHGRGRRQCRRDRLRCPPYHNHSDQD